MKRFCILMILFLLGCGKGFAAINPLEDETTFKPSVAVHPNTIALIQSHVSVFEKQHHPSKKLLTASIVYQNAMKDFSNVEKTWAEFRKEFYTKYDAFLTESLSVSHNKSCEFFLNYPHHFLEAFLNRLYFPHKETISAYGRLEDDYVFFSVQMKAERSFQHTVLRFTQEYSQAYCKTFSDFLRAFKEYQRTFYKSQPSYLEAALSFVCCFPFSKL